MGKIVIIAIILVACFLKLNPAALQYMQRMVVFHAGGDYAMKVKVLDDPESNASLRVHGRDIALPELEVGESTSIDTGEGPVTISRDIDGWLVNDGKGEARFLGAKHHENQYMVQGRGDYEWLLENQPVVISGLDDLAPEIRRQVEREFTATLKKLGLKRSSILVRKNSLS